MLREMSSSLPSPSALCTPPDPALAPESRRFSFWIRLRPLAHLAPFAINWPGGRPLTPLP